MYPETLEGRAAIPRDRNRTEKWAKRNLITQGKCLPFVISPCKSTGPWAKCLESSCAENHLGVLVRYELNQQCVLAVAKASHQGRDPSSQSDPCKTVSEVLCPLLGTLCKTDLEILEQTQ